MASPQVGNGHTILVAEDEPEIRNYLEMALKCQGYCVRLARDGDDALQAFRQHGQELSAVLLDIVMPRKDGFEALKAIRSIDQEMPVVMVSGASSPMNVVEAMKIGATDFIGKPVSHEDLRKVLERIHRNHRLPASDESESLPPQRSNGSRGTVFFGSHPDMKEIESLLERLAWSEAPVLIQGETGAGKEVLVKELHLHSPRAKKPFLKLNCAALPSELVESELFGYERGAFTGAFQKKPGMFELADGGTILLDEIGDMDFKLQAKLLQVLQDQEFQRLGGKEIVKVDVRVIAATHRDLERATAENTFRQDLYYRISVINLRVPPLRERKEDILPLARLLIEKHASPKESLPKINGELEEALQAHDWPGNIRELENVMRKLVILRDPDMISRDLRGRDGRTQPSPSIQSFALDSPSNAGGIFEQVSQAKQSAERNAILSTLNATRWNRKKAARLLNIDYKALLYKMKKLGIEEDASDTPKVPPSANNGKSASLPRRAPRKETELSPDKSNSVSACEAGYSS